MKESDLRKWHRRMGIGLALFIVIQAGRGLLITLGELSTPHTHAHTESVTPPDSYGNDEVNEYGFLGLIHHGGGVAGSFYRSFIGIGAVGMALSGSTIFVKSRARGKRK